MAQSLIVVLAWITFALAILGAVLTPVFIIQWLNRRQSHSPAQAKTEVVPQ
ncbi:MAG: hypothetical protein HYX87_06400 [Chloroflexi bacterium]|nr:hypothetical protein [Chloroflexota bacterium]